MGHGRQHREHNNHRSSERRFEKHIIQIDGKPIGCRKLLCATPGCGQQGELIDRATDGLPPPVIVKKFTQKGWEVGDDSSGDYCPSCVKTRQEERRKRRLKPVTLADSNVVSLVSTQEAPMLDTQPQAMSRADRRIIHNKLEEVYIDEDKGYRPPWSDAAVARDLGSHIPVAWVAEVREQSFGPAKDNDETRDILRRAQAAAQDAKALVEDTRKHRKEVSALVDQSNALMKRVAEVAKTIDGLLAIASRIEKAVT